MSKSFWLMLWLYLNFLLFTKNLFILSKDENENTDGNVIIEDDSLIFERTLKEDTIYNENFAEEMEKSLEEKKEQFIEIVDLFEHGIDNDNIKVVVRYKDKDNIIFEKEFAN